MGTINFKPKPIGLCAVGAQPYDLSSPQIPLNMSTISAKLAIAKAAPIKFVLSDTGR
jgi:hypothetical protein